MAKIPLSRRLYGKAVAGPNGCILWTGYVDKQTGYGQIGVGSGGRHIGTHVAAYYAEIGPLPTDKPCVLHSCDVRRCINFHHLFAGTHGDNAADMAAKGRGSGPCKVTPEQVAQIREQYVREYERYRYGWRSNVHVLADEFGLSVSYIRQLMRGEFRRHGK